MWHAKFQVLFHMRNFAIKSLQTNMEKLQNKRNVWFKFWPWRSRHIRRYCSILHLYEHQIIVWLSNAVIRLDFSQCILIFKKKVLFCLIWWVSKLAFLFHFFSTKGKQIFMDFVKLSPFSAKLCIWVKNYEISYMPFKT